MKKSYRPVREGVNKWVPMWSDGDDPYDGWHSFYELHEGFDFRVWFGTKEEAQEFIEQKKQEEGQ